VLAVAGVLITEGGWRLVDRIVFDDAGAPSPLSYFSDPPIVAAPEVDVDVHTIGGVAVKVETYGGPLVRGWNWASQPFIQMFRAETWRAWLGLLLDGLWAIAVWALFGGAIARIAALYLTQGETIGPVAALKSALFRWQSTTGAPLLALIALFVVALPLMFAGLVGRFDVIALLEGLLWFLMLLTGIAAAIVAIGFVLGWPMMWSTVAVERTDAFDGVGRAYAYVYQRPLHAVFYVLVAGLLGLLAQAAVSLIVDSSIDATRWGFSAGAGDERTAELIDRPIDPQTSAFASPEETAARMIRFWTRGIATFAAAFPMAYLWPAAVGIYLLLRRQIDSADLGEIKFDEGDPKPGVPALAVDPATGVPHVANRPATTTPPAPAPEAPPPMP
jgi:hypothetical protein